jgi:hypothetical protein
MKNNEVYMVENDLIVMCKLLQDEVNRIIKSFYDRNGIVKEEFVKEFDGEGINWSGLKCSFVKKCFVIYIEEADPNCENLREFIKRELALKGLDVEVITYW